jgi:hypothetical protein
MMGVGDDATVQRGQGRRQGSGTMTGTPPPTLRPKAGSGTRLVMATVWRRGRWR